MRFPWSKRETRDAAYSDAVAMALASLADGDTLSTDIAALEICRGWWGRAFASATVTPESPAAQALTPAVLNQIGRSLVQCGEIALEVRVTGDGVSLEQASTFDIRGGAGRDTWTYLMQTAGPDTLELRTLPASRVVHLQYASDPDRPWVGIGPMAGLTRDVAARLEQALAHESGGAVGQLVPSPPGDKAGLQGDIRGLKGRLVLVDSMAAGWDTGTVGAPRGDWDVHRLGPTFTPNTEPVRESVAASLLAACGISPAVLGRSDGTLLREAYRQFVTSTIAPIAKIITPEMADKLDLDGLSFDFTSLRSADVTGRARAYAGMVGAGLSPDQAMEIAGLVDG